MWMEKKRPQKKPDWNLPLSHSESAHGRGYSTKPLVSPNYLVSWHTSHFVELYYMTPLKHLNLNTISATLVWVSQAALRPSMCQRLLPACQNSIAFNFCLAIALHFSDTTSKMLPNTVVPYKVNEYLCMLPPKFSLPLVLLYPTAAALVFFLV